MQRIRYEVNVLVEAKDIDNVVLRIKMITGIVPQVKVHDPVIWEHEKKVEVASPRPEARSPPPPLRKKPKGYTDKELEDHFLKFAIAINKGEINNLDLEMFCASIQMSKTSYNWYANRLIELGAIVYLGHRGRQPYYSVMIKMSQQPQNQQQPQPQSSH